MDGIGLGASVALGNGQVVVSAPSARSQRGAIYSFCHQNGLWSEPLQMISSPDTSNAMFGNSVSCDQGWMATGSPQHSESGNSQIGAAYFYDLFRLDLQPTQPIAGQPLNMQLVDGTESDWAYLAASIQGIGSTPIPGLDVSLDLISPEQVEWRQLTDASGSVSWSKSVPMALAGMTLWLQGAQYQRVSNVVEVVVQ